jgi:phosphatidylserine/phosphatidylglycerophosphate/cardiolipin synthase-like enzyme
MKPFQAALASAAFVAVGALSYADPAPTVHFAPAENLEHIDVGLIDTAKREIDFAAYVLTDWPIMQALTRAAKRGVTAVHSNSRRTGSRKSRGIMWPDNETTRGFLNFSGVADTVAEIIVQARGRPISIGVSGAWGVGKSSLIKLTQASLG